MKRKEYNVIFTEYATNKILVDCNLYAESESAAIEKAKYNFKKYLYYTNYNIYCKAV